MTDKSLTFQQFLLEYSQFDTEPSRGISEDESNSEERYQRFVSARTYLIDMLRKFGDYNSEQAEIWLDRTARKFNLSDNQKKELEIDIFDWENFDNDDMNAGIEESHLHLLSMDKNVKDLKTFGWRNKKVKKYEEWNPMGT